MGVCLLGSTDWLAVRGGRREMSVAVDEERDERMDGWLKRDTEKIQILKFKCFTLSSMKM